MVKRIAFAVVFISLVSVSAESIDAMRVFYFGNSLTGCTQPQAHEALGKSAGKEWKCAWMLGAGAPLFSHRRWMGADTIDISTVNERDDDLTLEEELLEAMPIGKGGRFFYEFPGMKKNPWTWDGIVLQHFGPYLRMVTNKMWGADFGQMLDIGDIQAGSDLVTIFLKTNPEGKVFLYDNWPDMDPGKVPPEGERPEWAQKPNARLKDAEFPQRDSFDYETKWLLKHNPNVLPWKGGNQRSRDYGMKLFAGLKDNFPELWNEDRLSMIPVGDVFWKLDVKMKAGQVPGITTIKDYYTDRQHTRVGLPRYTAAATFYAVIFGEHPKALDYTIYNDWETFGREDPHHDKGELLVITPEVAEIVNNTIWDVVTNHEYVKLP